MFPETFEALMRLFKPGATGLVFPDVFGKKIPFFTYSKIQNAYNRAFIRAGLPYRSTHVMRHGGNRKSYRETNSNIEVSKRCLGNDTMKATLVYTDGDDSAYREYVASRWEKAKLAGRNWSQEAT